MQATAIFLSIFVAVLVSLLAAMLLPLRISGKRWREAEEKARVRRLADAKMEARLLRFNL